MGACRRSTKGEATGQKNWLELVRRFKPSFSLQFQLHDLNSDVELNSHDTLGAAREGGRGIGKIRP